MADNSPGDAIESDGDRRWRHSGFFVALVTRQRTTAQTLGGIDDEHRRVAWMLVATISRQPS